MPRPKSSTKESLTVRLAADTLKAINRIEQEKHVPKSATVQLALNEYLAKNYPEYMAPDPA